MTHQPKANTGPGFTTGVIPSYKADPRDVDDLTGAERGIMLILAAHMNYHKGYAALSVATLARRTGHNRTTVQRSTRTLVEKKRLIVEYGGKGPGQVNRYRFVVPEQSSTDAEGRRNEAALGEGKGRRNSAALNMQKGQRGDTRRAASGSHKGSVGTPKGRRNSAARTLSTPSNSLQQQRAPAPTEKRPTEAGGIAVAEVAADEPEIDPETQAEIRRVLRSAGVKSADRIDELASGVLTLDDVEEALAKCQGQPPGHLVNHLGFVSKGH